MIIPTSRRGELRVVLVPPGAEAPPATLTAVLLPADEDAPHVRALLFGIE